MAAPVPTPDPWSQGLMASASFLGGVVGKSGTSTASSPYYADFDSSGWVVNTGSGSASNQQSKSGGPFGALSELLSNPWVLGAGLVGLYLYLRK